MAIRAIVSVIFPDHSRCVAPNCTVKPHEDLIITKCNHIFCRSCLQQTLESQKQKTCPNCRGDLEIIKGQKEYTEFKPLLDRFTYYLRNDLTTLENAVKATNDLATLEEGDTAAKIELCFKRCKTLEIAKTAKCSICLDTRTPLQRHFIIQDKITGHVHEKCLEKTAPDTDRLLSMSVSNLIKVAKKLPEPPPSPVKVFFVMIFLPLSIWALAMNARVYYNKSILLYLLSFPALVIFKTLSLLLSGVKAIFAEKHA